MKKMALRIFLWGIRILRDSSRGLVTERCSIVSPPGRVENDSIGRGFGAGVELPSRFPSRWSGEAALHLSLMNDHKILRRAKKLLLILAVAAMAVNVKAENLFWAGTSSDWNTSSNWVLSGNVAQTAVPGTNDRAIVMDLIYGGTDLIAITNTVPDVGRVDVGFWGNHGTLTVEAGGSLSIDTYLLIGELSSDTGTVINHGEIISGGDIRFRGAANTMLNTGTITCGGNFQMGVTTNSASEFTNTGDMTCDGWFSLSEASSNSIPVFNMNGGTVNIAGDLIMSDTGRGHINLNGGTITAGHLAFLGNSNYTINVAGGTLVAPGDHTAGLNGMVDLGLITAFNGYPGAVVTSVYDNVETTLYATGGPVASYADWDASWVGVDLSSRLADYEGDGLDNLQEYAFGGNPTNNDAATFAPGFEVGTDVVHTYNRRISAHGSGELSYELSLDGDLVVPPMWVPADDPSLGGVETVGDTANPAFESVTNRFVGGGAALPQVFLKLEVTEN